MLTTLLQNRRAPGNRKPRRGGNQAENLDADWKALLSGIEAALELRTQNLNFESIYRLQYKLQLKKLPVSINVLSTLRGHFVNSVAPRLRQNLSAIDDIHQRNQSLLNDIFQAYNEYVLSTTMLMEMCKYLVRPPPTLRLRQTWSCPY